MSLKTNDVPAKIVAIDIEWDFDDKNDSVDLPESVEIPEKVLEAYKEDEDAISDYLSDQIGFCHKGFRLVKITEDGGMEDYEDD